MPSPRPSAWGRWSEETAVDKTLLLEIVTPDGLIVSSKVEEVYLPGSQGDMDILPGHAPLITSLKIGELHYKRDKQVHYLAVNRGFAEITPSRATVLVDTAEPAVDIDADRARAAKARAEEKLKNLTSRDMEYPQQMEALERARVRLRVAEKAPRE